MAFKDDYQLVVTLSSGTNDDCLERFPPNSRYQEFLAAIGEIAVAFANVEDIVATFLGRAESDAKLAKLRTHQISRNLKLLAHSRPELTPEISKMTVLLNTRNDLMHGLSFRSIWPIVNDQHSLLVNMGQCRSVTIEDLLEVAGKAWAFGDLVYTLYLAESTSPPTA